MGTILIQITNRTNYAVIHIKISYQGFCCSRIKMRTERVLPWFICIYQYITSAMWNVPIGRLRAGGFVRATFCGWWHTSLFEEIPQVVCIVYLCHYSFMCSSWHSSMLSATTQACDLCIWDVDEGGSRIQSFLATFSLAIYDEPNKTYYNHFF